MSVRRSLIVLLFGSLLLPLVVFGAESLSPDPQLERVQSLQLYRVERGSVELTVNAIGTIQADQVVQLSFVVPGRVDSVWVETGDYVLAGDVLVELENNLQSINYQQATLSLERAEVDMEELNAPVDEWDLMIADANIDAAWGTYYSIANAVTADDLDAAELAYQQQLALYNDLITRRDQAPGGYEGETYNMLDAQAGAASFNAEIARLQWESLKTANYPQMNAALARVRVAEQEKDRLLAGPTQFEIDRAEVSIQQAEAQLTRAKTAYDNMFLTAPFEGVVSSINFEPGTIVGPGVTVIELTDISPLHLTVAVDEIDIGLIDVDMPARIELDALPGVDLPASLKSIATVGQNDGGIVSYDVDMTLDSTDPRARVGMTAEASVVVDAREDVLIVPNLFVRLDRITGQAYVNLLGTDNTLREVEIELGLRGQDFSEVLSGVGEGDLIAIDLAGAGFSLFGN